MENAEEKKRINGAEMKECEKKLVRIKNKNERR
jgi:hypothetical protein